jgi:hemoglobin-like flavoprotein
MTDQEMTLIETSWKAVAPIQAEAARLFYGRLFELDPALRDLFQGDMEEQGRKLMQMLSIAVANIRRPEQILESVQALGRRHAGYGVKTQHYDTVGQALLWTLDKGLGPAFTPETRTAWTNLYGLVAGVMQDGVAAGAPG